MAFPSSISIASSSASLVIGPSENMNASASRMPTSCAHHHLCEQLRVCFERDSEDHDTPVMTTTEDVQRINIAPRGHESEMTVSTYEDDNSNVAATLASPDDPSVARGTMSVSPFPDDQEQQHHQVLRHISAQGIAKLNANAAKGLSLDQTLEEVKAAFEEMQRRRQVIAESMPESAQAFARRMNRPLTTDEMLMLIGCNMANLQKNVEERMRKGQTLEDAVEDLATEFALQKLATTNQPGSASRASKPRCTSKSDCDATGEGQALRESYGPPSKRSQGSSSALWFDELAHLRNEVSVKDPSFTRSPHFRNPSPNGILKSPNRSPRRPLPSLSPLHSPTTYCSPMGSKTNSPALSRQNSWSAAGNRPSSVFNPDVGLSSSSMASASTSSSTGLGFTSPSTTFTSVLASSLSIPTAMPLNTTLASAVPRNPRVQRLQRCQSEDSSDTDSVASRSSSTTRSVTFADSSTVVTIPSQKKCGMC